MIELDDEMQLTRKQFPLASALIDNNHLQV